MSSIVDEIVIRFETYGATAYIGEPVSVAEHMLQSALAAEEDGADASLVVAALLHDYGHLLHDLPEDAAERGIDTRHEDLAADLLAPHFGADVIEPIRLHVAAKRYLCAVDPAYRDALSPASELSLDLQGGPMTPEEVELFARSPHAESAVRLRRYDDAAKVAGAATPSVEHYRPMVEALCRHVS